ncbi:hypothetical protein [Thermococcus sp.]
MKKLGILLIGILLVSLTAGCIGGKTSTTTTSGSASSTAGMTVTATTPSPTTTTTTTTTTSPPPKKYTPEELLKRVKAVRYFTFTDNTTMIMQLTMEVNGSVMQRQNMTFELNRRAYVDLENREAEVNGTTRVYPGGAGSATHQVVMGDTIYVEANGITHEMKNATIANLTWNYNPISLALLYLARKPEREEFKNGTQFLYYNISAEDMRNMMAGFAPTGKSNLSVWNGILELGFRDGKLISERTMYEFRLSMSIQGSEITEVGKIYDEIRIFDVNIKKNVKIPEKSVKA